MKDSRRGFTLVFVDGHNSPSCVNVLSWLADQEDIVTIPKGVSLYLRLTSLEPLQFYNISEFLLFL